MFADLGLAEAEKLKIKSGLVIEITRAVRRLGLTQEEAGRRMGIPQPKVSGMMRGDLANLSERHEPPPGFEEAPSIENGANMKKSPKFSPEVI